MPREVEQFDVESLRMILQPICGQPLTDMYRLVGQVFEFGVQKPTANRKGEAITRGDFSLKFISADWRIIKRGRIILGSTDQSGDEYFYNSQEPQSQPYDKDARSLALEFMRDVKTGRYVAQSVEIGAFTDVTIRLSENLVIESFASSGEDHDSWWCHNHCTDVSCLVGPSGHNVGQSEAQ